MPDEAPEKLLDTVAVTAARLSISEDTVWRLIAKGDLPSVRIGRRVLVPVSAIEALAVPQ